MKIIKDFPPQQEPNIFVALDLEITGLNPKQLHRPTSGEFACLSIATDPETVYIITDKLHIPVALGRLRDTVSVYQNAKFDITHLRRWADVPPAKKLWDTMLIERIMYNGYFDFYGLDHLARRWLDMKLDKSLQSSFENTTELSEEQILYTAKDVSTTLRISNEQRKVIKKSEFNIWAKVDRPALWAYMDFMGFAINVAKWQELAERNKQRVEELDKQFSFNPRSPVQVKKVLSQNGFKRLQDTQEKTLLKFIHDYPDEKAAEIATAVLESRKIAKRASTYGMNFIEHYIERDIQFGVDMIYCDYDINRAKTGRTASSDPNMQNIPARETNEYRECFIARPDNLLLIFDYSQQEAGILAQISGDKAMQAIINSGENIYIGSAKRMFEKVIEKGGKEYKKTKSTILGTNYGMSPYGLADRENISVEEAEDSINRYFRAFPDAASWIIRQKEKKDYTETIMGRKSYLNRYDGKCERNAMNNPMQGSAADMMKMAIARIHQGWTYPYPFPIVAMVHDEVVLDVPKNHADEIAQFVKGHMEQVASEMCPDVKIRADVVIGDSWGAKT